MNSKPEVVLEFDLLDVVFVNPGPKSTTSGALAPKEVITLRDPIWATGSRLAVYAIVDGRVIPFAIPDDTKVELVVSR